MKSFKEYVAGSKLPIIDRIIIVGGDGLAELYEGRKWVSGRFENNIGIDRPTHRRGQQHAHVLGRKRDEVVVVNFDGTSSHGKKGRLHDDDADALRARGFQVRSDNIVEWRLVAGRPQFLLG